MINIFNIYTYFRGAYIFSDKAKPFLNFIRFRIESKIPQNITTFPSLTSVAPLQKIYQCNTYFNLLEVK